METVLLYKLLKELFHVQYWEGPMYLIRLPDAHDIVIVQNEDLYDIVLIHDGKIENSSISRLVEDDRLCGQLSEEEVIQMFRKYSEL